MTDTPAHTPLPCPFCGSKHLTVCEIIGRGYTIECEGCHIEGPLAEDGPSLLERWNTRSVDHDDLLALAHQYASDLRHPPSAESVERRLERIAAVLAKVGER